MADLKISQLPAATTPLAGTEPLPIVQSSATEQVSVANLTAGRAVSCLTLASTATTGTAPFTVASTTNVANLNASSLNGATFAAPGSIGSGTAGSGAFTTLSASSTVSGAGFSTYLASPPAIGGTAAAAGTFTQLTVNGSNVNTSISPTGTGTVTISPAGALTISPTAASTINNASIGATTASTGRFTSVETTGTIGAGIAPASGANITIKAGSTTVAPLQLTTATSALLATPAAGVFENDTSAIYYTADTNAKRGIIPSFQFVRLASAYTTASGSTALQQLFNTTAAGAVTVTAGAVYEFECVFGLSSLSATSGNVGFGFGGTATLTSIWYTASCNKGNNMQGTNGTSANNTQISAASTATSANAIIKGILVINAGGTIVPSFSVTVAAAAVVGAGSFFKLTNIGSSATVGAWT